MEAPRTQEAGGMRKTSVWWDIENCNAPESVNPSAISLNISLALHSIDIVGPVSISAYGDMISVNRRVQSALAETGVALNHIPCCKKESSDKAILVNMAFWAQDNPPPANVVLISGDSDFSTILHRLRMHRYTVILVLPDNRRVADSLVKAASLVWYWSRLLNGEVKELGVPRPAKPSLKLLVLQERNSRPDPVGNALEKLKLERVLPTETYVKHCLRYWQEPPQDMELSKKLAKLAKAGKLHCSRAQDQVVYFPQGTALWKCVNFGKGRCYGPAVWHELDSFFSGPGAGAFVTSQSWFDAALVVKKCASGLVSEMTLGDILDLIYQAIGKSWIRVDPVLWSPVIVDKTPILSELEKPGKLPDLSLMFGEKRASKSKTEGRKKTRTSLSLTQRGAIAGEAAGEGERGEAGEEERGEEVGEAEREEARLEGRGEEAKRPDARELDKPREASSPWCLSPAGSARKRPSLKDRRKRKRPDGGEVAGLEGSTRKKRKKSLSASEPKEPNTGLEDKGRGEEAGLENQAAKREVVLVQQCKQLVKERLNTKKCYSLASLKTDFAQRYGYELDHTCYGYSKLSHFAEAHLCPGSLRQEGGCLYLLNG